MKGIVNIILRELKFIFKSKLYISALIIFPIVDILFLGGIYVSQTLNKLPITVIDNDNSKISKNIVRYFNACPDMEVKTRVSNVYELQELFNKQKSVLGLYIPKNFQKDIKRQKSPSVTLFVNASNYISGNITDSDSTTILSIINAGIRSSLLTKKGIYKQQVKDLLQPVRIDSEKLFNPSLNYNFYLTPGIWLSVIHQFLILIGVLTLSTEFDLKTIYSLIKKSKRSLLIMFLGKMLVYLAFVFIHFEILYLAMFRLFNIPVLHSNKDIIIYSMCFAFASMSFGMFLAALLKTRLNALKGCLLFSAPAFLLSGYTWPLDQMPYLLRNAVHILPLTSFLEGFRKIYQQNVSIEYTYCFMKELLVLGLIYFLLSYIFMYFRIKKYEKKYEN
ncbi:MAG: ABC transporter permease [Endomicrobium sp.]|jgi:ABC-2 type transport system permease protein|nr:ABC transporter permease [Endomicrobium sp.]